MFVKVIKWQDRRGGGGRGEEEGCDDLLGAVAYRISVSQQYYEGKGGRQAPYLNTIVVISITFSCPTARTYTSDVCRSDSV